MKLAVISDIHSNLLSFKFALKDAEKENVDSFLFLGDYITDGEDGNEILNIIKEKSENVILGNREKYILNYSSEKKDFNNYKPIAYTYNHLSKENIDYIKTLPKYKMIEVNRKKILMIHGDTYFHGIDAIKTLFDSIISDFDFDICLFGHTHQYLYQEYKGKIFINPGSIGISTDTLTYKYCILEIEDDIEITLKEFQVSETFKELEENYKKTNYYKENYVWANLILKTIEDTKDHCVYFLELFNCKIKGLQNITANEFNQIWNETYEEYVNCLNE